MATAEAMAFHFKAGDPFAEDKESAEYWSRHHDEGTTDFFNQYVILDDPDVPSGPPEEEKDCGYFGLAATGIDATVSPPTSVDAASTSHLNLHSSVASSSDGNGHDYHTGSTIFQSGRFYNLQSGSDPVVEQRKVTAHGSSTGYAPRAGIADSDLMGLEGLPIRSSHSQRGGGAGLVPPAGCISVPSSPHRHNQGLPHQPSQSHSLSQSPTKKPGRLAEMFSSIRSKTNMLRTRPRQHTANISSAPIGSDERRIKHKPEPPMTPPLTGRMTPACPSQEQAYNMSFVNSYLDDPFEVPSHNHHANVFPNHSQEAFHHPAQQQQQQSWQHQDTGYPPSSSGDEGLWNPSYMDTNYHHTGNNAAYTTTAASAKNATLNLALHLQQQSNTLSYHTHNHYPTSSSPEHHHLQHPGANLLLHMPQPRHPSAPILHHPGHPGHPGHTQSFDGSDTSYLAPATTYRPLPSQTSTPHRRPKPRAPSSGARYGPSHTSPRKPPPMGLGIPQTPSAHRNRSVSSTTSSPSPTARQPSSHHRVARRTTSLQTLPTLEAPPVLNASIRKRRSRSKSLSRHSEPRTPSPTKGGGIGFVNFTPDDSKLLMTGVAPSGSSKTKARREKEAVERQRRLSEALVKAVTAAGGDVERLKEETGLVLGENGGDGGVKMEMEW